MPWLCLVWGLGSAFAGEKYQMAIPKVADKQQRTCLVSPKGDLDFQQTTVDDGRYQLSCVPGERFVQVCLVSLAEQSVKAPVKLRCGDKEWIEVKAFPSYDSKQAPFPNGVDVSKKASGTVAFRYNGPAVVPGREGSSTGPRSACTVRDGALIVRVTRSKRASVCVLETEEGQVVIPVRRY